MATYLTESKQTENSSFILEYHRNQDGSKEIRNITNFKPYFYVDQDCPIENYPGVINVTSGFKSLYDKPVKKVTVQQSSMVKPLRQQIESLGFNHFEADILFNLRYLFATPEQPKCPLRVCWLDIETASPTELDPVFPDINQADQSICCLTVFVTDDSLITEKQTWLCGESDYPGTRYFKSEEVMLNDFLRYFQTQSPDLISSWNLRGFDLPYLINRCKRLVLNYKLLSPIREVSERPDEDGNTEYTVRGLVQLDLLDGYRLWRRYGNMPKLESYSLDFVAKSVLDDKKLEHNKSISYLWKYDVKTLIEYNQHDVELLVAIDNRCKVIDFFDHLRRMCHVNFQDVYQSTRLVDGYLISRLNSEIILPTAKHNIEQPFTGAYVSDSKKGVYKNVLVFDIKSLYPSIIRTFNISPETYGGKEIILPTGQTYSNTPGLIPRFMDELFQERKKFKKLMASAKTDAEYELWYQRQYSTKVILNIFYGFTAYSGSRLCKPEVSQTVTQMGQYIIKSTHKLLIDNGYEILYSDTDAAQIIAKEQSDKLAMVNEGVTIKKLINNHLEELALSIVKKNYLEIEFEKVMKVVLFTEAKKRYAYKLLWDDTRKFRVDNKIHVTGFDQVRSDTTKVSKIVQKRIVEMILEGLDKPKILEYLNTELKKFKSGKYPDQDIGFPKGITKPLDQYNPPTALIKGAFFSNKVFNTRFGKGSKPKYVYIKNYKGRVPMITLNKKTYELETIAYDTKIPDGFLLDYDKMIECIFEKKLTKILDAVGIDWKETSNQSLIKWIL